MLQDQTIKLWDTRMLSAPGKAQGLHIYEGHKEPVGGLAVHREDVISWAGNCIGLLSMQVSSRPRGPYANISLCATILELLTCLRPLCKEVVRFAFLTAGARKCSSQICPSVNREGVKGDLSLRLAFRVT